MLSLLLLSNNNVVIIVIAFVVVVLSLNLLTQKNNQNIQAEFIFEFI